MLTKIEKYLEKYAPIFISISMYYLIILLVWEIITK
jgi:hypothetical protein